MPGARAKSGDGTGRARGRPTGTQRPASTRRGGRAGDGRGGHMLGAHRPERSPQQGERGCGPWGHEDQRPPVAQERGVRETRKGGGGGSAERE